MDVQTLRRVTVDELCTLTVKTLKTIAQENGISVPSRLKKQELATWIHAKIREPTRLEEKYEQPLVSSLHIEPVTMDPHADWLEHLRNRGWAVVPIEGWPENMPKRFFDWIERYSEAFDRYDPDTWTKANLPFSLHGIMKHYLGHTDWIWEVRLLAAPYFAQLWEVPVEDLITSFDGACFMPVTNNSKAKQWIHCDQPRAVRGFTSVQGVVNYRDCGPEDGGLLVCEDSHLIHDEYMDQNESEGLVWGPARLDGSLLSTKRILKVCAPAGSLILFDSRMFHSNIHPRGDTTDAAQVPRYRMASYVSMVPRDRLNAAELKKHIQIYETGRMTGHNCYGPWFQMVAKHPHTHGSECITPEIEIEEAVDPLMRRLIGYDE